MLEVFEGICHDQEMGKMVGAHLCASFPGIQGRTEWVGRG